MSSEEGEGKPDKARAGRNGALTRKAESLGLMWEKNVNEDVETLVSEPQSERK